MLRYDGVGLIPMATTNDLSLQCYMAGCSFVGNGICKWNNCCLRFRRRGGCSRRFCQNHKFEKIQFVRTKRGGYNLLMQCCTECGDQFESDIVVNSKCNVASFTIGMILLVLIALVPLWATLATTPLSCEERFGEKSFRC